MNYEYLFLIAIGLLSLIFTYILYKNLVKKSQGNPRMAEISGIIQHGAKTYLKKQYTIISIIAVIVALILIIFLDISTGIAFLIGAILSACSGIWGMYVATSANARTAEGCRKSLKEGLRVAFSAGTIIGTTVVGLGFLGVIVTFLMFKNLEVLFGFGFGASFVALFARVGGGIFTKAADVGADLVGKVEAGIPEDDPRNPATIADNVGDNVGDVAGTGADLFESYVQSIIAAMSLALVYFGTFGFDGVLFPLLIASLGIVASVIGTFFVRVGKRGPGAALNKGVFVSFFLALLLSFFAVYRILGVEHMNVFYAILTGLVSGIVIVLTTIYYTSEKMRPVKTIARASETGAATNILTGFSIGMRSAILSILAISIAMVLAFRFAGLFGIAIAAVGMLSTLGITLATDGYGPITDNAEGIAEMSSLNKSVREKTERLDAVGNTTKAIGKGFAIGSAALTALALFAVYGEKAGLATINALVPEVLAGVFIGALLPFIFSSFLINSVGRTAVQMVKEVRRQFHHNHDAILKGKVKPDYSKPIEIATKAALKEMIIPGLASVLIPIIVGILMGAEALGGLLVGTTITGLLLAITLANSGGAWDNAKKYIEKGNLGGKGSEAHKAAVIGDTVGDPFKDTAGPSLNILIKIVAIVSLLFILFTSTL
jgi:K(+)-stimulated pyrophosphate-energized sodium pump